MPCIIFNITFILVVATHFKTGLEHIDWGNNDCTYKLGRHGIHEINKVLNKHGWHTFHWTDKVRGQKIEILKISKEQSQSQSSLSH